MRTYNVVVAADALGCTVKWIDNCLERFEIPDAPERRQGVSRQLPYPVLLQFFVARALAAELGLPLQRAIAVASELCAERRGSAPIGAIGRLEVDLSALDWTLTARLRDAVERSSRPRRGRPPAPRP